MVDPCFDCGFPAAHSHHVVPHCLGGRRTVRLCLECHSKVHGRRLTHTELIKAGQARARAEGKRWGGADNTKGIGRDEFIRRTKAGQARAKAEGKNIGRNLTSQLGVPKKLTPELVAEIKRLRQQELSLDRIGQLTGLSRPTVSKVLK